MPVLDATAYDAFLLLARRGLITFDWDPDLHPRDHNGRWKDVPDIEDGKLGSVLNRDVRGLPNNSQDLHTWRNPDKGHRWEYTPERRKLHEAIVEAYLAGKSPVTEGTPRVLFTAGGAGSGKTTALDQLPDLESPDAVLIDPDDIKVLLPEYAKLAAEGDPRAMHLVHDESMDIADMLRRRVFKDRYNATVDGTGAGPQFRDRIGHALDEGYEVEVAYFNTDLKTAQARIEKRRQETGRAVNKYVAIDMHRNASRIFHDVFEEGVAMRIYDTTGEKPQLVMEAEAGADPEVHDQDAFDRFLKKADAEESWKVKQRDDARARRAAAVPKGTNPDWSLKPEAKKLTGKHGMSKGTIEGEWNLPELYMADEALATSYAQGGTEEEDGRVIDVEYNAQKVLVIDTGAKMRDLWVKTGIEKATEGLPFHPDTNGVVANWARAMGYDAIEITPGGTGEDRDQDEDDAELGYKYGAGTYGEPQTILLSPERATIDGKKPKPPKPKWQPKWQPKSSGKGQQTQLPIPGPSAPRLLLQKGARVSSPAGNGTIAKVTGPIVQVLVDGEKKVRRYEVKDLRGV